MQTPKEMLKHAENALLEYAIGICPKNIQSTLKEAARTDYVRRKEILDLVIRLDSKTIKSPSGNEAQE